MRIAVAVLALLISPLSALAESEPLPLSYGPRPAYLIDQLPDGDLKLRLQSCAGQVPQTSTFSIGHRGAALMFPEHTDQSYLAAARMGAGIVECDVTFTADHVLVCRHAQNDLATTTDILLGALADSCKTAFSPSVNGSKATAECRTSELTLEQFRQLTPKMDSSDKTATTVEQFQGGMAPYRSTLYANGAKVMTHAGSIALLRGQAVRFTPELKAPKVSMPFNGFSQTDYAQKLIDEYKDAGIPASDVWPQSFDLADVLYWIKAEPEFGRQAVLLDGSYRQEGFDPNNPASFAYDFAALHEQGVNYIAPPLWVLVTAENGNVVPSAYARAAGAAGLNIIAWTLERSGPLDQGGGWYYQSIAELTHNDGMTYQLLDVLAQDVGVVGVFSDWPATVTYYANCMGL